jgi:hypothetical protein
MTDSKLVSWFGLYAMATEDEKMFSQKKSAAIVRLLEGIDEMTETITGDEKEQLILRPVLCHFAVADVLVKPDSVAYGRAVFARYLEPGLAGQTERAVNLRHELSDRQIEWWRAIQEFAVAAVITRQGGFVFRVQPKTDLSAVTGPLSESDPSCLISELHILQKAFVDVLDSANLSHLHACICHSLSPIRLIRLLEILLRRSPRSGEGSPQLQNRPRISDTGQSKRWSSDVFGPGPC